MSAAIANRFLPIQLTLELCATSTPRRRERPFWDYIDDADLGGELRGRAPGVRVFLSAEQRKDGLWVGYHDLLLGDGGSNGPTPALPARQDALASAAYRVMEHCEQVLAQNGACKKADARAAKRLLGWLQRLDLL